MKLEEAIYSNEQSKSRRKKTTRTVQKKFQTRSSLFECSIEFLATVLILRFETRTLSFAQDRISGRKLK